MTVILSKLAEMLAGKAGMYIGIGVLALTLFGALYWQHVHLKHDLALSRSELLIARSDLRLKEADILRLKASVREQNSRIATLGEITRMREEAVQEARAEARRLQDMESEAVDRVRAFTGSSCSDGIALMNRELGL